MTAPIRTPENPPAKPSQASSWIGRDEIAYVAPMAVFLLFIWVGATWPSLYAISYLARTALVAALLVYFRRYYTRISWEFWWLGAIVGVIGIFQWIGMQLWLQEHFEWFRPKADSAFDPFAHFSGQSPAVMWGFIAMRVMGAVLVVPVMEELFWRDFLWRQMVAPNDFKMVPVGEFEWSAFLIMPVVFATVHGNWWPTAIVWGLMVGALLVYTKSLGACIVAHAVTNLLLAAYVLKTRDWSFW